MIPEPTVNDSFHPYYIGYDTLSYYTYTGSQHSNNYNNITELDSL